MCCLLFCELPTFFAVYVTLPKYLVYIISGFFLFNRSLNNPGLPYLRRVVPIKGEIGQLGNSWQQVF